MKIAGLDIGTTGCKCTVFDEKGQIVYRISRIGIQLEDLASMECVIAVAGGTSKAKAIVSYMKHAPKQTCLITDEGAAKAILKE